MATLPFDISSLNTALGAYARENSKDIIMDILYDPKKLRQKITAWDLMERVVIRDERVWGVADFDPEVQDAANAFSDQGGFITIDGRKLKMRYMRSDFKIEVHKLYNSWLAHIEKEAYHNRIDIGDLRVAEVAFGRWIVEGTMKKIWEKFMLKSSFLAEYAAGYNYTNSFDDAVDGFKKVVSDARTALTIPAAQQVAAGGPITNANAYTHYEALGEAVPENLFSDDLFLVCAVKNYRNYNKGFKAGNPGANRNIHDAYKRTHLEEADNVTLVPTPELGQEDISFITPRNNMLYGTDFDQMPPEFYSSVAEDPLVINCTIRMGAAFGFKREKWLTANDQ